MAHDLRFRQVHLDFHTSPAIPGIGDAFDKRKWQETLKQARVNSITTFGSGHHGWSYYDTKVGERHPGLSFDLLRAQFDASKEIDVNVPIYLTAGVHNMMAEKHPEWREVDEKGSFAGWSASPLRAGFKSMCFNTPYLDHLCDQISEVVRLFPNCDGIFLDIIHQSPCCCEYCMTSMRELGFDPAKPEDRKAHSERVMMNYYKRTTDAAKCDDPDMAIFHNSGHIAPGRKDILPYFSHLELESLPTGGWGYDHFPMSAKYCKKLGLDFLGMTGKFHTTWGEFGGYKHPNALRYECAAMLAFGSKCSVGDQLHPNGDIDVSTYEVIGAAYSEVEIKEPWCVNAANIADVALMSSLSLSDDDARERASDTGATRILLDGHFLFDILDGDMDFSGYKMLILPDDVEVSAELKLKIDAFLAAGGKLLLSGDSGLDVDKKGFLFDIGADFFGKSEFEPDYLAANERLRPSFVSSPMAMYMGSNRVKAVAGESFGSVFEPYFNREYKHFCSHQHTPPNPEKCEFDCAVLNGNILYLAHPIFGIYRGFGAVAYKEYCVNAINLLLGDDASVKSNLPSMARLSLTKQDDESRYILHLLYATTITRGGEMELSGGNAVEKSRAIEVIDELLPLRDVEVTLALPENVKTVTLEPQGVELPFERIGDKVKLAISEFTCHQMVVLKF